MDRLLLLLLLMGFGFSTSSVKADPVSPNTNSNVIDATNGKPISPNAEHGIPKDMPVGDFDAKPRIPDFRQQPSTGSKGVRGYLLQKSPSGQMQPNQKIDKDSGKVVGKFIGTPKHPIKSYKRAAVGDFGPLPTNSYKRNSHKEGDVPPHASDFGTVPIESGPDTRRAK